MKVHQFPRAFWDHVQPVHEPQQPSDLAGASSVCKRFRSLAPKMAADNNESNYSLVPAPNDLNSFIRQDSGPRRLSDELRCGKDDPSPTQVEMHQGGTRWNPTQEQIGILEMLYKGGMRTPNAHQIEQIAEKLAKYGKIEGKNVFYWFQNHKARERQKQKRERLGDNRSPRSPEPAASASNSVASMLNLEIIPSTKEDYVVAVSENAHKRRCRSWTLDHYADEETNEAINNRSCRSDDESLACRTLQLFPLHPEGNR
ncbi:unnamed protein product [Rhodiola kirilowii]